jgi:AcrR family transcriptional regulator
MPSAKPASVRGPRSPVSPSKPRKARAVGLSRERIVAETLRYLRAHPSEPFTLARAAATVDATSMALYRHFKDGADLADAIVDEVLSGIGEEIPAQADWRTQVGAWMKVVYSRLLETPQCIGMMGTENGLSAAWMRAGAVLRRSLAAGGLTGPALSEAVFWVSMVMTGYLRLTLAAPAPAQVEGTLKGIEHLSPEEAAELEPLAKDIPRIMLNGLEIIVARTLASVDLLRDEQAGRQEL